MSHSTPGRRWAVGAAVTLAVAACGPSHRLAEYDFRGATLAAVAEVPARPDILTGPHFIGASSPVEALLQAGSRAAREVAVRSLRGKIERAEERVNVGAILEDEAQRRAGRYLRADASPAVSEADFLLEVFVHGYGIEATDWDASAYFFMDADATLLDQRSGAEVWRAGVKAREPMGPEIFGPGIARDVVTAAAILDLSEEDVGHALERLADFAAAQVTDRLRGDLADARRR